MNRERRAPKYTNEVTYTRAEWAELTNDERGPCDEWEFYCTPNGYGRRRYKGKLEYTHRIAWIEEFGYIPDETPFVLHHCDAPPCIRISHLFLGTQAENVADRDAKGRDRWTQQVVRRQQM